MFRKTCEELIFEGQGCASGMVLKPVGENNAVQLPFPQLVIAGISSSKQY